MLVEPNRLQGLQKKVMALLTFHPIFHTLYFVYNWCGMGGFHVVAKIITEDKSHMIPYEYKCSYWL